jgi:TRAP-type C4-dicarboxylate transport system permease small subunit
MFGSAYVYGSKEHLTIDILKDKFGPKTNMVVEIITNVCLFAFVLVVCVIGGYYYTVKSSVQVDPSLLISKAYLYVSVPFTGIITLYYAVYNSIAAVRNYHDGKRQFGDELSGTA